MIASLPSLVGIYWVGIAGRWTSVRILSKVDKVIIWECKFGLVMIGDRDSANRNAATG